MISKRRVSQSLWRRHRSPTLEERVSEHRRLLRLAARSRRPVE